MDKLFGKKKTVEQQLRDQDREMRRNQRGLQRDRAGLEKGKCLNDGYSHVGDSFMM